MSDYGQLLVTLRDGTTWDKMLSADKVILLLMLLLQQDFRVNQKRIFPALGIDMETRRLQDNVPNVGPRKTHEYRIVNKAQAMEMLSGLLLCHLDRASEVRCMCELGPEGLPLDKATSGSSDVYARYENPDGTLAFRAVVEVSSQKVANINDQEDIVKEFYFRQLNQAWKFADELAKDEENGLVYGLVINGGRIGAETKLRRWYREFAQEKGMKPDGNVRVLPLYAGDLGNVAQRILEELPEGRLQFSAGIFGGILDALIGMLLPTMESFIDDDWIRDKFFEIVSEAPSDDPGGILTPG